MKVKKILSIIKNKTFRSNFVRRYESHQEQTSNHIALLVGIALNLEIKSILELGAGFGSTPVLNNRNIFKSLKNHVIVEGYKEWQEKISSLISRDTYTLFNNIDEVGISSHNYELVFIDDGLNTTQRRATIDKILKFELKNSIIIIHDFEHRVYRSANYEKYIVYDINFINPNIGVVVHRDNPHHNEIKKVIDELYRNRMTHTDKLDAWVKIYKNASNSDIES